MTISALASWSDKPTLVGELVTLRPLTGDDAAAMAAMLADVELLRLTGSVNSTAEAEKTSPEPDEPLLEWYCSRNEQSDRMDLGIVDNATGVLVGEVVLNELDEAASACNFRTLIGTAGRGRGLGTEATRLMVGYGFERLGLHRISLDVFAFNPRAERVYRKVGFGVEGVRRDAFRFDGEYVDEIMMAILAPEWEQHRGRLTLGAPPTIN